MIVALVLLLVTTALVLTFAVALCAGCLDDFKSGNTSSSARPSDPKLKRASSDQLKLKKERKPSVGGKSDIGQVKAVPSKENAKSVLPDCNPLSGPPGAAKTNGRSQKDAKAVGAFKATAYPDNGLLLVDNNHYQKAVARAKAQRAKERSTIDSGGSSSLPMHSFTPDSQCGSTTVKSYQTESFQVKSKSVIGSTKCKETSKISGGQNSVLKVSDPKSKM